MQPGIDPFIFAVSAETLWTLIRDAFSFAIALDCHTTASTNTPESYQHCEILRVSRMAALGAKQPITQSPILN